MTFRSVERSDRTEREALDRGELRKKNYSKYTPFARTHLQHVYMYIRRVKEEYLSKDTGFFFLRATATGKRKREEALGMFKYRVEKGL